MSSSGLPLREDSYMLISGGGNSLGSWADRGEACEELLRILAVEPDVRDEIALIAFDTEGMAVRRLWPQPERPQLTASPDFTWDWEDADGGNWRVGREPREAGRLAIKSGPFTIFTVGDYFDGGGPIQERLGWVCDRINEVLEGLRNA